MKKHTKKLTTCAVFAALICIITAFVAVPAPAIGNINLGDVFILCSSWLLGPLGAVSSGLGACLADIFSGYAIYAPATLVIKAAMALGCHYTSILIYKTTKKQWLSYIISAFTAEGIMSLGYFAYECIIYSPVAAVASLPFNLLQGSICLVVGVVAIMILFKSSAIKAFKHQIL